MNRQTFIDSYVSAMLDYTTDGDSDRPLSDKYGPQDIDPKAMASIERDCDRFLMEAAMLLGLAESLWSTGEFALPRHANGVLDFAGYDFFHSRQRSGVGFWEPDDWPDEVGPGLDRIAKTFGEFWPYVGDDGKVYV